MPSPTSSRSVDPRLASASGLMRDTVGGIHNLSNLLGSMRVGPKALSRVIPDVHASCAPMALAAGELVRATSGGPLATSAVSELGRIVAERMGELETALHRAETSTMRASDRLSLETTLARVIRDLDGALELVDLLVEASATGSVPVDVTDVIRENSMRLDPNASRARRANVVFVVPAEPIVVMVNPRLAMRLFGFAAALVNGRDASVGVEIAVVDDSCRLTLSSFEKKAKGTVIATPLLIELSARYVVELAKTSGATLDAPSAGPAVLTLPIGASD